MAITRIGNIASTIPDDSIQNVKFSNIVQSKNIIINGDMSIAQRATSVTGIGNGDAGYHTCDRWKLHEGGATAAEFTQSQSTDVPTGQGFATSLKMDCTTADTSLAADEIMNIYQRFEGQNLQYLKKGTSSAESLTLSFWVKATKTGTYVTNLYDNDNNRAIGKTYTISSSDTWEKKTLTFAGDTTGALDNDNANSLEVYFQLFAGSNQNTGSLQTSWGTYDGAQWASGQVNVADSTSNNWLITGVQLEAGTTASEFEFLPYDVNLQRCERYYQKIVSGNSELVGYGYFQTASSLVIGIPFQTTMRTDPTLEATIESTLTVDRNGGNETITSLSVNRTSTNNADLYNNSVSSTQGVGAKVRTDSSGDSIAFVAEL